MRILLTGGTGFIGSQIASALAANGHPVVLLVRPSSDTSALKSIPGISFLNSENKSPDEIMAASKAEGVVHCAATYGNKGESAEYVFETNVVFPFRLAHAAANAGSRFFINTDTALPARTGIYAATKKAFRDVLEFYGQNTKMPVLNMQLEYVYGPGNRNEKFFVTQALAANSSGKKMPASNGTQRRDFIYVKDVATAYAKAATAFQEGKVKSGFTELQIGSGKAHSLRQFVSILDSVSGRKTNVEWGAIPAKGGDLPVSVAKTAKAKKLLGWKPVYTLEKGLNEMISEQKK